MGTPNDVAKGIDYVINNKYFNGKVLKIDGANNKNYKLVIFGNGQIAEEAYNYFQNDSEYEVGICG